MYLTGYSKSQPSKKYVVAAVVGTLIAVIIILTGFFVGMSLGTIAPGSIVKVSS